MCSLLLEGGFFLDHKQIGGFCSHFISEWRNHVVDPIKKDIRKIESKIVGLETRLKTQKSIGTPEGDGEKSAKKDLWQLIGQAYELKEKSSYLEERLLNLLSEIKEILEDRADRLKQSLETSEEVIFPQ